MIKGNKGFSLIELVMVFVLLGILSFYAIPKFASKGQFEANLTLNQVLSTIKYIQKLAISSGCQIQVSYGSNTFSFNRRASCTSGVFSQPIYDPVSRTNTLAVSVPSSVSISSTNLPFYFDGFGRARSSASNNVTNPTITVGGVIIQIDGETGFSDV